MTTHIASADDAPTVFEIGAIKNRIFDDVAIVEDGQRLKPGDRRGRREWRSGSRRRDVDVDPVSGLARHYDILAYASVKTPFVWSSETVKVLPLVSVTAVP